MINLMTNNNLHLIVNRKEIHVYYMVELMQINFYSYFHYLFRTSYIQFPLVLHGNFIYLHIFELFNHE